jgi:hypothetical protein
MRQISSKMTFFYKRIFPILWFGFLAVFFAIGLFSASRGGQAAPVPFLIMPVAMAAFGYWIMRKLIFNLVDEVLDAGDALIVRGGGREERIALSEIKNVNYTPYMSPPQVTLSVRRRTSFGETIAFCAPVSIFPFWTSPVIQDLIDRIDAARSRR